MAEWQYYGMVQHVLVALDGSPPAMAALRHALATHPESTVTVLHVIEPPARYGIEMGVAMADLGDESRASDLFAEAQGIAREYGVEIATVVRHGSPHRAITEMAASEGVDHIVMGSHGRTGVGRLLFGSVAERVVRRAPVPVTIVKTPLSPPP